MATFQVSVAASREDGVRGNRHVGETIFSLFPCLGFPLGVAAVCFGVQGLRRVRATPEVRGGAHAWVGLICGGLFGLFNLLLVGAMLLGIAAASMER